MEIEVLSWEKYQTRKDLKSMPWFKINSDIGYSESLFGLKPEQKWLWIFILSTCARKMSPKIEINFEYFVHNSGLTRETIVNTIQVFENKGLVQITNGSVQNSCIREEKRREEKRRRDKMVFSFLDYGALYKKYPLKKGKKRGIEKCGKLIKSKEKYDLLEKAIENYAKICEVEGTDKKYIKHFSTFMGEWEDFIDPEIPKSIDEQIADVEAKMLALIGE